MQMFPLRSLCIALGLAFVAAACESPSAFPAAAGRAPMGVMGPEDDDGGPSVEQPLPRVPPPHVRLIEVSVGTASLPANAAGAPLRTRALSL